METRIYPDGQLEMIEYGQRTVYNLNGDIIYRVEGNIIEEIEYSPTGELEIYKIKVGNVKCQYGPLIYGGIYKGKIEDTIDILRERSIYEIRASKIKYKYENRGESLDWELRMEEEEQRCPNYYDNLNNIF